MRGAALLAGLSLASCSAAPDVKAGGIVSNNPCIDSILARIAAPGQISAVSSYSHDAGSGSAPVEWARRFPALGTGAEGIIAAKPGLVLTGNLASSGTNAALAKAGLKVVPVGVAATLAEDMEQVRAVAKAIDRVEAGENLVEEMAHATSAFLQNGKDKPTAIIWQNGGFVAGAGTVQDELLRRKGFVNASAGYGLNSWDILPVEVLIRNPPDVIFMPLSGKGKNSREVSARQKLLRHLGNKVKIVHFPDRLLFCGGPTTVKVAQIFAKARGEMQ